MTREEAKAKLLECGKRIGELKEQVQAVENLERTNENKGANWVAAGLMTEAQRQDYITGEHIRNIIWKAESEAKDAIKRPDYHTFATPEYIKRQETYNRLCEEHKLIDTIRDTIHATMPRYYHNEPPLTLGRAMMKRAAAHAGLDQLDQFSVYTAKEAAYDALQRLTRDGSIMQGRNRSVYNAYTSEQTKAGAKVRAELEQKYAAQLKAQKDAECAARRHTQFKVDAIQQQIALVLTEVGDTLSQYEADTKWG